MIKKIKLFLTAIFSIIFLTSVSQEIIDEIVAVVGDKIILKSDIESQHIQIISQGYSQGEGDTKCDILEEMLFQKLLLNQALYDSVEVTNNEVDREINRRLNVFINQYGSEQKLEELYGKSIAEIRADFRYIIRDQLLTQRVQMKLVEEISVTPSEVKQFFNSIPKDSLPVIDAYFEYSELVIEPKISQEEKKEVIEKLESIRQRILDGESFETLAVLFSEDQGSAMRGGELGFASREDLVPEFAAVAFNLNISDVSRVVETQFGYHIIQLVERRGTLINVRHILMTPKINEEQLEIAEKKIGEIYELIKNDSVSFVEAVREYSDGESKFNDGIIINPMTGTTKIPVNIVEQGTRRILNRLNPGEISNPFLSLNNKNQRVLKIIKLDRKVEEHIANLDDDYRDIQEYALQQAQQDFMLKWINDAIGRFYIRIDDSYANCQFNYADWEKKTIIE